MAGLIIFSLLFLIPFFIFPFATHQFEPPKVVLAQILIAILGLSILISKKMRIFEEFSKTQLLFFIALFVLSLIHLFSNFSPLTIFGNEFRLQGILLLWSLLAFSLISSIVKMPKIPQYIYFSLLLMIFISSLFIGNQNARAVGTIGEPNALAAFVIFLWPFVFFANDVSKKTKIIFQVLTFLIATTIILLASSLSGLVALCIQCVFAFLIFKLKIPLLKASLIAVLLISLLYLLPFFDNAPYENRLDVWQTSFIAGLNNPILGWGFGNIEVAMSETSSTITEKLSGYYVDSGHNIFLDWWMAAGIVGLEIFVLLIIFTIKNFVDTKKTINLVIFFGLITALSFNPASIVSLLGLWWLIGEGFANRK